MNGSETAFFADRERKILTRVVERMVATGAPNPPTVGETRAIEVIDGICHRGIPQSYYVDEFIDLERDPRSGYVLMPVTGFPALSVSELSDLVRKEG